MRKILAIDGGGIRGVIPAVVLAEIERRTGRPAAGLFDLIAGTSTGGILALGLSRPGPGRKPKFSAADLLDLYASRGQEIFSRSFWKGMASVGGLADEKYSHKPLEKILKEYFGTTRLERALTKVLVSAYDLENRKPFFFKSWRSEYNRVEMRRAARATSAAPTYFEPARVPMDGKTLTLIDGGVYVNNPAMSAYAEARKLWPDEDEYLVVSLGTGQLIREITFEEAKDWGKLEWAVPILNVVFDGVSAAVDYQLAQLPACRYHRFQVRLETASDDMDNASAGNIENLKAEAGRLLAAREGELEEVCGIIKGMQN
jgi:patatin-like phospholipase/acyl hydrolase